MKYTPGPWRYGYAHTAFTVSTESGQRIAVACAGRYEGDPQEEADARLIAAAPVLVEALLVITLDKHILQWFSDNDPKALAQARAALRLAGVEE